MSMTRPLILAIICCSTLCAADSGVTITPAAGNAVITPAAGNAAGAPAGAGPRIMRPPQQPMPRSLPAYEVELLSIKTGDPASITAWTLLASQGYRITAAIPGDGGATLYLERPTNMTVLTKLRLPSLLEQDQAAADALRAKMKDLNEERLKAVFGPAPTSVPNVTPIVPPAAPTAPAAAPTSPAPPPAK